MVTPVGVCAYEVDRSIDQPEVRASGTGDGLKVPVEHRDHALDDAILEHQRASWRKTRHDSSFVGDHLRSSIPQWWPIYAGLAFGATGVTASPLRPRPHSPRLRQSSNYGGAMAATARAILTEAQLDAALKVLASAPRVGLAQCRPDHLAQRWHVGVLHRAPTSSLR